MMRRLTLDVETQMDRQNKEQIRLMLARLAPPTVCLYRPQRMRSERGEQNEAFVLGSHDVFALVFRGMYFLVSG